MDGTRDHHIKQNKPDSERQIPHVFFHMWNLYVRSKNKDMNINGGPFQGEPTEVKRVRGRT
jgi:hypothetical protein